MTFNNMKVILEMELKRALLECSSHLVTFIIIIYRFVSLSDRLVSDYQIMTTLSCTKELPNTHPKALKPICLNMV